MNQNLDEMSAYTVELWIDIDLDVYSAKVTWIR